MTGGLLLAASHWDWLHHFWASLGRWEAWVAIGTLALAATTGVLALLTFGEVRVARAEAQASVRPVLVDVPEGTHLDDPDRVWLPTLPGLVVRDVQVQVTDPDPFRIYVPMRNVGVGPAFVRDANMGWVGGPHATVVGEISGRVVPPGERTYAAFEVEMQGLDDPGVVALVNERRFWVRIRYADLGGVISETTFSIASPGGNLWRVERREVSLTDVRMRTVSAG